jgi:MFS family permease
MSFGALFGLEGLPLATRRGLAVAFATSISSVMGVQLIYPVLAPMMQQLGASESAIGLVVTAYTVPMIFLAPIAGAIADLHGRRPLLFGGLVLFGLAGAGVGLAPTFEWVLALRALQGVGASAIMPLTIVLLSDLVDGHQETSAQGLKVVLDRVATIAFPLLAGILAAVAWQLPFYLFALAVGVAFMALAWLPETRRGSHEGVRAYVGSFKGIGRRPRLLIAFSAGFLRFFLDYGYFTYLPIYLALARDVPPAAVGLLFGAFAVGAMITASQAGRIVRGRDPADLVFVGFALGGVSVLLIPLLPSMGLVAASLFIYGLGNGLISPLQKTLLTTNAPPDTRAGVVSLDRVLQQVAKSIAPALMGVLLVFADVTAVFWVLGGISLVSVALAALLLNSMTRLRRPVPAG